MSDIPSILSQGIPIPSNSPLTLFIERAISTCEDNEHDINTLGLNLGECLAAIFDLAISGVYADKIGNNGWIFCRHYQEEIKPVLLYPFVNACPRCSVRGKFAFTPSKKPESAVIGQSTSLILATIFQRLCNKNVGNDCKVYTLRGSGIVDAYIQQDKSIGLLEIKAAPLVTFPFCIPSEDLTYTDTEGVSAAQDHEGAVISSLATSNLNIYLANIDKTIPLGARKENRSWPFDELTSYASEFSLFRDYLVAWKDVYDRYSGKLSKDSGYWLANGCGQPVPRPERWPMRRVGTGYESVSDSKSSVGMDRTDDIKKGIYQVLKIGTHYKEFLEQKDYNVTTILASNMHAIKHHDDYLLELEDIIWSVDSDNRPYKIVKSEESWTIPIEGVHNLYDGLISLTRVYARDKWIKTIFKV